MHPVEALHGDLGMVVRGDVVLALSASGETEEILRLLATLKRLQVPLISMTGDAVLKSKSRGRVARDHTGKNRFLPWRRPRMSRSIAPSPRRLARLAWRRRLRPRPCSLWGMRWP